MRERVSVSYIYELPFGKGKPFSNRSGWARAIADGWQLSGVTSVQTGLPFTPVLSSDPTNTGTTVRPNAVLGATLYPARQNVNNWFNAAAYATPAAYTFGNAGRNILRGPLTRNNDVGLERTVNIGERFNLRFLAEAFNVFNTPQYGLPNNKLGVATTGVITTVVTPERQFQLGLRFAF